MCAVILKAESSGWSRRYRTALSRYIRQGPDASLRPAQRLGHEAVAIGLETLDLARVHEQTLMALLASGASSTISQRAIERARRFFTETIVAIEKTHNAALKADIRVNQLTRTLKQRTVESSASTRHLKQGIAQRQAAEAALKKSAQHRALLLQESSRLQHRLRRQTREILSAQEEQRSKTSRQLHDEIAQVLLAIDLRLLAVKTSTQNSTQKLGKEIAGTQRMMQQSAQTIKRLTHEFGGYHEA